MHPQSAENQQFADGETTASEARKFIREEWNSPRPDVMLHTSGSTGTPKQMAASKQRMLESARITCDFLGLQPNDTALLCLSTQYIAGKMMVVRSLQRSIKLCCVEACGHPLSSDNLCRMETLLPEEAANEPIRMSDIALCAMVPLQAYNSLQVDEEARRLAQIRHLIIGGGAIDHRLARLLRPLPNAVYSTYGMTETLSHIALRRISGPDATELYTPFSGIDLDLDARGCLVIHAPHLADAPIVTNDVAELVPPSRSGEPTRFKILGRADNVICSGGIKLHAEQLEEQLAPHLNMPLLITKKTDEKFGEAVVLFIEATDDMLPQVRDICQKALPKYAQPRHIVCLQQLPRTPNGKPARREAQQIAEEKV